MTNTKLTWEYVKESDYEFTKVGDVEITVERRSVYCDRGNWLAKIFDKNNIFCLDSADGWPRYYMNLDRAKLEIEDWINKRLRSR